LAKQTSHLISAYSHQPIFLHPALYIIFINDAQDNEVFAAMIATLQGDNKFQLPTQNYASGTYFVRIVSPKKESISSQIVVQH